MSNARDTPRSDGRPDDSRGDAGRGDDESASDGSTHDSPGNNSPRRSRPTDENRSNDGPRNRASRNRASRNRKPGNDDPGTRNPGNASSRGAGPDADGPGHDDPADGVRTAPPRTTLDARSLALSVLLGTHPPELPARALVALAGLFGIAGGTMRTALSRMAAAGEVEPSDGRYRLTGTLLDRQRSQDVGRRAPDTPWDGSWHSIVTAADQRDLAERRRFRATMANHRFGELRPDIWMRPANEPVPPADQGWIVVTGELTGLAADELARRLWDLPAIERTARSLLDDLTATRRDVAWDAPTSIPVLFTTSAAVVRFLRREPRLPAGLTPPGWPVDELRAEYDAYEADFQRLLAAFLRSR